MLSACGLQRHHLPQSGPGATSGQVQGSRFLHKTVFMPGEGRSLHVYLEGDGRPWIHPRRVSLDPTPANPVMFSLFSLDDGPALYLGRPCYWQVEDAACEPKWWTSHRYAEAVVDSLDRAIDHYRGYVEIRLFGYSGGGSLAMLLAARRADVTDLVTIAANLDIAAWTALHGYSPLRGSLNPAEMDPLPGRIRQHHFAASADKNVPPELIETAAKKQANAVITVVDGYNHACCWETIWPEVLADIRARQPSF